MKQKDTKLIFLVLVASVLLYLVLVLSQKESRLTLFANLGNTNSMYELSRYHWDTNSGGKARYYEHLDKWKYWLVKAAKNGHTQAMYDLARNYGGGGYNPSPEAIYWYTQGAEAGDPNCMGELAEIYKYGYGNQPIDLVKYRYWMDKAMAIDKERSKAWRR